MMKFPPSPPFSALLFTGIWILNAFFAAAQSIPTVLPSVPNAMQHAAQPMRGFNPMAAPVSSPALPDSMPEKKWSVQFPHASAIDILNFYELMTGKKTIRDSQLTGPEISINVPYEIPQHEAIALVESSLLLNGYTLIPVDDKTVKVLGVSHPPRSEGLPLYLDESELPTGGDELVSFYKPLRFLGPDEAETILTGVIQASAYTSLVAVPNTGAIVITEKVSVIRKALALLDVVDREPTQIITEFIPLERANAETVVDTLTTMFGNSSTGGGRSSIPGQPQGNNGAVVSGGGDVHLLSGKPQFIADKRTNRLLIVVKAENYKYLRELIAKLDQPADSSQPLIRPLNYLSVSDVYPVLLTMLQDKDETNSAATANSNQQNRQNNNNNNNTSSGGSSGSSSSGGPVANTPDKLQEPEESSPQSTTVGPSSVISDPSANSIIVYGPPDAKARAREIINILDQRPKQVYLAAVIGELTLTEGVNYGASWFANPNNGLIFTSVGNTLNSQLGSLANTSLTNILSTFPSSLGGLTIFGTVAQGIATYANFLESTGKFRTLSRPVVYTSNNKKAVIFSGQSVPIPANSLSSTVGSVGTNALNSVSTSISYLPVVLKLEVIPLINADREVNLQISQHNDTIGASNNIGGNQVPTIDTQELTTTVRVPNGSTIVLGGLITDDKTYNNSGIPYINRIPIIGPLLGGQNSKSRTRSELVVMIQPIVVDDDNIMVKASDAEGGQSELGKKSRELQEHLQPTPSPTPKRRGFHLFGLPKIDNF